MGELHKASRTNKGQDKRIEKILEVRKKVDKKDGGESNKKR